MPFSKTDHTFLKMFEATDLEHFSKIGSMIRLFWEFFFFFFLKAPTPRAASRRVWLNRSVWNSGYHNLVGMRVSWRSGLFKHKTPPLSFSYRRLGWGPRICMSSKIPRWCLLVQESTLRTTAPWWKPGHRQLRRWSDKCLSRCDRLPL